MRPAGGEVTVVIGGSTCRGAAGGIRFLSLLPSSVDVAQQLGNGKPVTDSCSEPRKKMNRGGGANRLLQSR